MRQGRLPTIVFGALFAAIISIMLATSVADPDLWGHVLFGQDMIRSHTVTERDPYSFTSDRPWVNHEWLAEVSMAAFYRTAGTAGLLALSCLCGLVAILAARGLLAREQVGQPARFALVVVAFFGLSSQLRTIRPQIFSAALFALLLLILVRAEKGPRRLLLCVLPLFAAWANLHGGWIVGLAVVGLWAGAALLRRAIPLRWGLTAVALALLGSLLTPYGTGLWRFLSETVGLGRNDIEDWQPLFRSPSHLWPWLVSLAITAGALRRGAVRNGLWPTLLSALPVLVLALLTIRVYRLEGFLALSAVMLLGPVYAGLGPREWPLSRLPTRAELGVVIVLVVAGLGAGFYAVLRTTSCLPLMPEQRRTPEPELVEFIRANKLQGKLLTWFDYGEYGIWHLSPALRVSYDGRRETVYSDAVQKAHLQFYFNSSDASYARSIGADYVWLPIGLPVIPALERDHWVRIFQGARSVVLSKAPGRYIYPSQRRGPRCFPGP